jgi:integrase/recombinase XerD
MKSLHRAVDDYLALRRSLGYKLRHHERSLHPFISFLKEHKASYITSKLALEYVTQRSNRTLSFQAYLLGMIRNFAAFRIGADPRTEIPAINLLPSPSQRAHPYLYSKKEIRQLLAAALGMKTRHPLSPQTHYCLLGLFAVSGLRLSEAINLQLADVDLAEGILTVRGTKFGKSRLVPLHRSVRAVLLDYARRRDQFFPRRLTTFFFVNSRGRKVDKSTLTVIFHRLSRQIGIRQPGSRQGPRLHDFRHRFAIETLLGWYRHGKDATRCLPVLSTFLGHVNVTHTYWYLGSTPELMTAAGKLLEARWKGTSI